MNPQATFPIQIQIFFKIILLLILIYWSYQLIFTKEQWIFLDYANLIVHETGHLIFMFTSQFITILAGSVFQVVVPVISFIYFSLTKQTIAIIFSIFWIGNNLINVSHYIKDASTMRIDLAFGATVHDWNWLLTNMNILKYDQIIGNTVFGLGIIFVFIGVLFLSFNILNSILNNQPKE